MTRKAMALSTALTLIAIANGEWIIRLIGPTWGVPVCSVLGWVIGAIATAMVYRRRL